MQKIIVVQGSSNTGKATAIKQATNSLGALTEREFFAKRLKGADFDDLRQFLNREGGEPPREGDELPERYVRTRE